MRIPDRSRLVHDPRGVLASRVRPIRRWTASASAAQGRDLRRLGESGSGKPRLGLAIMSPDLSDGPVVFMGHSCRGLKFKSMRPFRRNMQIVFQDP